MNAINFKKVLYRLTLVSLTYITYGINAQEIAEVNIDHEKFFNQIILQNLPVYFPLKKEGFKRMSSSYGLRNHPVLKKKIFHSGIDLAAKTGTPIYASANGKVTTAGYSEHYGNYIIIQHKGNYKTLYGHMLKKAVAKKNIVRQGELIGFVGSTGRSTGPHLHFEIFESNKNIDPYKFWIKTIKKYPKIIL